MDFKMLKKALQVKMNKKKKHIKGAAKSYVSLFAVAVLVVAGTTAWLTAKDRIGIQTQDMDFKSTSGIHDDQLQTKQTEITIPNFRLEEASSVDGRNIYFPSSIWNNVSDPNNGAANANDSGLVTKKADSSSDTLVNWPSTLANMDLQTAGNNTAANPGMRFREGNAGDKNVRYAYVDTDINSSGDNTKVWLKGYKVVIGDDITNEAACNVYEDKIGMTYDSNGAPTSQTFPTPYSCPVRIAIIDDSGHTPKVFDPSARVKDYVNKTNAVYTITSEGKPTLQETTTLDSFSSYYYGTDNPLFEIEAGHKVNMTVVAWLEGTHPYAKNFVGKQMTVSIEVETNVSQMEEIYLHDWTIGDNYSGTVNESTYIDAGKGDGSQWLASDGVDVAMSYYDNVAKTYKTAIMTRQTDNGGNDILDSQGHVVYKAAIPKYVSTKISFYRLSKSSDDVYPGTVFNAWHSYSGVNNELSSTAKNWKVLGNLTDDRYMKNSNTKYTHYFAIRGNGHSYVAHNADDRYSKWLSPGIGYWGTASGPVKVTS